MTDSIYLGEVLTVEEKTNAVTERKPLSVPRNLFGHMHLRGMTGAGKTSLGIIPLVSQFAAPYGAGDREHADAIFVIDFGGDQNAFWNAYKIAKSTGRTFRFLTLDQELLSYCFPPFQATPGETSVIKVSQMLIRSFHMEHGLVYGGSYYSQQNLAALLRVARKLSQQDEHCTLEDIARYLDDPNNRRDFKDAEQVRMTFSFLLEYPQLREHAEPEMNIDIDRALAADRGKPELIYFFCPTLEEPLTAPLVGGLALYSIIGIAIQRKKHGRPTRRIRIFIDEFQEIVGRSLAALLAQCRKFGISLILANQSTSQLANKDLSLADSVFEGTSLKQYYTCVGDADTEVLRSLSQDKIRELGGMSGSGLNTSLSTHEYIDRALARDTILEQSATFGRSFVIVNDGCGHQEPLIAEQVHKFPDLSAKPMEKRPQPEAPAAETQRRPPPAARADAARQATLLALAESKRAEEAWEMVAGGEEESAWEVGG